MTNEVNVNKPRPARRTIVKGAAWAVPVVTVATAAPAFAASPPVDPSFVGNFCKHSGNPKYYHNTMMWTNTNTECSVTVELGLMTIGGASRQTYASVGGAMVTEFTIAAGETKCIYVDAGEFDNSQNSSASLSFTWTINCPGETPIPGGPDTVSTPVDSDNNLPPCGTGADPGGNPKDDPAHGDISCAEGASRRAVTSEVVEEPNAENKAEEPTAEDPAADEALVTRETDAPAPAEPTPDAPPAEDENSEQTADTSEVTASPNN